MSLGITSDAIIKRRDDESDFDYHRRVIYAKLVDKTLPDVTFQELSTRLYKQEFSEDVCRRLAYGSCKTLQLLDADRMDRPDDEGVADEIDSKILTYQAERQRYLDQRREYNKLVTEFGRRSHLEARIVEAANRLNEARPLAEVSPRVQTGQNEAVLVFADWHYGMATNNIWNKYDTNVCRQRVEHIVRTAVERIQDNRCRKLHILVLGDMAHGAIHTSARVASEELVCDQIMQVSEILAEAISILANYVAETEVYCTYGNHMRTVQNKNDSIHRDNMERLIPWWLTQRLRDREDIVFAEESDTEFFFVNVCGYGICATHGDLDTIRGTPKILSTVYARKYGKQIDYVLLADKHHREEFEELGIESIIVRCLCGTDDYANSKRLYSTPGQLLMIFNEACGMDAVYHLRV